MTGIELTSRLISNVETSLALRAQIPYLDMLKDLVEGGATFSSAILNTSSNFGSFDKYLSEILVLLNKAERSILSYQQMPLPLSSIKANIQANASLISDIIQDEIDNTKAPNELIYRLELVNAAAI